ncbi:hypothetical protein SD235_04845 [Burkholderia cepacia]|uniref:hypothetical protein n=1 Tax=Burkholderia cepacia TaxID=292 RepID=UPI003A4E13FB
MTILNFVVAPNRVTLCMDTAGNDPDTGRPGHVSKMLHLPHANVLFAMRGPVGALHDCAQRCNFAMLPNFDEVAWQVFRDEPEVPQPPLMDFFAFGWSDKLNAMAAIGYTFAGGPGRPSIAQYDSCFAPWSEDLGPLPMASTSTVVDAVARQISWGTSAMPGVSWGGSLLVAELTQNGLNVTRRPLAGWQ